MTSTSDDIPGEQNPFLKRLSATASNAHGLKSEAKVLKKIGAKPTPNSGALRGAKSDGVVGHWQVESKSTVKDRLPIELGWLVKIQNEALSTGRDPVITISYVEYGGAPRPHGEWVMVPLHIWNELKG